MLRRMERKPRREIRFCKGNTWGLIFLANLPVVQNEIPVTIMASNTDSLFGWRPK